MKKTTRLLITTFIFLFGLITNVSAESKFCTPSDEFLEWFNLPESEREATDRPKFCKEAYERSTDNTDSIENSEYASTDIYGNVSFASATDSRYSAVEDGYVTSVKNQKQTGTCWSFASTSLLESLAIKNGFASKIIDANSDGVISSSEDTIDLSEMHMVYGLGYDSFTDEADYGKVGRYYFPDESGVYKRTFEAGGYDSMPIQYALNSYSIVKEDVLSFSAVTEYNSSNGTINKPLDYSSYKLDQKLFNIDGYIEGNGSDDYVENLKERIIKYGSAEISIYSSSTYWNSNYTYFANLDYLSSNHAVTVVGWDDSISKSNFKSYTKSGTSYSVQNDGAWIVKNSWGTSKGKNGFFYVSYESVDAKNYNYNLVGFDSNKYDNTYKTTSMYAGPAFVTSKGETDTEAILFNLNGEQEELKKLSFAISAGVNCDIYYAFQNGTDWQNESNWIKIKSGVTSDYDGIISVTLDEPIYLDDDYAIIIRESYDGDNEYFLTNLSYVMSNSSNRYNDTKAKTSYYLKNGTWTDRYEESSSYTYNDVTYTFGNYNFELYAYTTNTDPITIDSENYTVSSNEIDVGLISNETYTFENLKDGLDLGVKIEATDSKGNEVTSDNTLIGTGSKIKIGNDTTYTIVVKGDISGDGKISSADYVRLWNHLDRTNSYTITDTYQLAAADITSDGALKSGDYVRLWNKLKRG